VNITRARQALKEHWGYDDFRKSQRAVIELALADNDVIAVLPTSAGKSACFQIPALLKDGGAIVITPLIALMKDQVDDCARRRVPATYINSHVDDDERAERIADFIAGRYKLLYVAPERFNSKTFLTDIARAQVSYVVCDEAHCCSEYGHDFRPDYMRINRLVKALTRKGGERPPILALTATATSKVVEDIRSSLGMRPDFAMVVADPIRPNIKYVVEDAAEGASFRLLGEWVRGLDPGGRHIVYTCTRSAAEKAVEAVKRERGGGLAAFYHAGMNKDERERVQNEFKSGATPIVCATIAFGMGVDVPNIRTVINLGIPGSIEAMVQQCGRAGRDGLPSVAVLIVDAWSINFQFTLIEEENPPWRLYGVVWEWLHRMMGPGEVLKRTLVTIAEAVTTDMREKVTPAQVGGILSAMHSKALIEKRPVDAGTPIVIDAVLFERSLRELTQPQLRKVAEMLWVRYVKPYTLEHPTERLVHIHVNKQAVREQAGVSVHIFDKALLMLTGRGIVEVQQTYTGNQITILQWRADLELFLSRATIEAKRALDVARLRAMVEFTRLETEDARNAFIRQYFLAPPSET